MAKGYWVVRLDVSDPEQFKAYQDRIGPFHDASGGHYIVRGGEQVLTEGSARQRTAVVEYPSYAAALAAYHSAEYQALVALRGPASEADFVIVEGVD
jgi:uncharacterized protein (DUF1330 family)